MNHAVRSEQWRYIRYADGGEELYDEAKDPYEWCNLAGQPGAARQKAELGKWLPSQNKPELVPAASRKDGPSGKRSGGAKVKANRRAKTTP